jgi:hypothetical protein
MSSETMNRFQRNDQIRAEKRKQHHGLSAKDAVAVRDKKREEWTGHNRPENQRGGLLLDPKTLAAKNDFTASRKPTEPAPVQQMSAATLESITRDWLSRNPGFYNSEFNRVSMRNFLQKNINENRLTPSVEMLDVAFEWLTKNNHIEKAPGTVRRRGEVVSSAVVTLFEYTPPEVQAALDQKQAARAIEQRAKEDATNRNLSIEELRQKAHAARGTISRESIRVFQG